MCSKSKIVREHSDQFPDFATLTSISLVVPLTPVPCERVFSLQNAVMTNKRNHLGIQHLNNKMPISSESRRQQKLQRADTVPYPMPEDFITASVTNFK
ncbi:hypothetical protein BaRGS_00003823 [Batillaria attramentaria]|uniref:HAT C-terminal dimerisation domain-containing protein n=1 Tax=Batillaria attramentaria TaxID=370345 RepID=A0ABD0LZX3_9CAEN